MPKITDAQRETRRQQILDAALRCFSRDGFHNTTTADIVREAGLSQGTLYLYFASKEDIVVALADDRHQGEAYVHALAQSEQDPLQGLKLLVDLYGRSLTDPAEAEQRRVRIQRWAEAQRNPVIYESVTTGMLAVRQAIARLIERGQKSGQLRPDLNADAAAQAMIAIFQGLTLHVSLGEAIDYSPVADLVGEMLRRAFLNEAVQADGA